MASYVVCAIDVHDADRYEEYKRLAGAAVEQYGGKYLVRGGPYEALEGTWDPKRLVVLRFDDADAARRWWTSPEYEEAKRIRQATAQSSILLIEGS